jgi:tyrosyl-tRNA synthetase
MESVKIRLEREQPLSFLEFNYMVCQAYDFVELYKRYGCRLQSCGSDQWGNVVSGIDLGRRMESMQLFGLSTPLITTSSGAKMGKSVSGAVWLNQDMLSVYDYWQFWRNTEDGDVGRFLRLFTDMPEGEIARIEKLKDESELEDAKKILATEATKILHGKAEAEKASKTSHAVFVLGETPPDLPTTYINIGSNDELKNGCSNTAIILASGFATTNSDARRKIEQRGFKINDKVVTDPWEIVSWDQADPATGAFKVQFGAKKFVLVKRRE